MVSLHGHRTEEAMVGCVSPLSFIMHSRLDIICIYILIHSCILGNGGVIINITFPQALIIPCTDSALTELVILP